jgi:hypothetical protein
MVHLFGDPSLQLAAPVVSTKVQGERDIQIMPTTRAIVTATVTSQDEQSSSGVIRVFNGYDSDELSVPGDSIAEQSVTVTDYFSWVTEATVAYTGCDVSRQTCLVDRVRILPQVPMTCGRIRLNSDGSKSFDIRFEANVEGPFELGLRGRPGLIIEENELLPDYQMFWYERYESGFRAGETLTVTTTAALPQGDSRPEGDYVGQYYFPYVFVEALNLSSVCNFDPLESISLFTTPAP